MPRRRGRFWGHAEGRGFRASFSLRTAEAEGLGYGSDGGGSRFPTSVTAILIPMLAGLISDTHGYLDPRALAALAGVEVILHAGDVGRLDLLAALARIAPVHAVQGNNDAKIGGLGLPAHLDLTLAGIEVHLVHELPLAQPQAATGVVVSGHSHRALIERRDGRLYVNPGAAGRTGFHRIQTIALLELTAATAAARIVELGVREKVARKRSQS